MTAWVHNHINNESSYDLILVDKRVGGSRNYKWQSADREPPVTVIPEFYFGFSPNPKAYQ